MATLARRLRTIFRLARVGLHLLWGVATAATVFPWLPERYRAILKRRWSRQLLAALGVRLHVAGTPPAGGLLVANHISWLDIYALNALAPTTFVAKDDIRHWPIIGWLSAQVGTLFIERGSRLAAQRTRGQIVGELHSGRRVGVFPEGTTGYGDQIHPFHSALFQSAIDAGTTVAPALLRYTDASGRPTTIAAYVGEISFMESLRAIVATTGLAVNVSFLPPLNATGMERRHLAHHCHQMIAHALAAAVNPSRRAPPGARTAAERPADPPNAPPSDSPPTDNPSRAPGDSSPA